jgi:hypothetical protein
MIFPPLILRLASDIYDKCGWRNLAVSTMSLVYARGKLTFGLFLSTFFYPPLCNPLTTHKRHLRQSKWASCGRDPANLVIEILRTQIGLLAFHRYLKGIDPKSALRICG